MLVSPLFSAILIMHNAYTYTYMFCCVTCIFSVTFFLNSYSSAAYTCFGTCCSFCAQVWSWFNWLLTINFLVSRYIFGAFGALYSKGYAWIASSRGIFLCSYKLFPQEFRGICFVIFLWSMYTTRLTSKRISNI